MSKENKRTLEVYEKNAKTYLKTKEIKDVKENIRCYDLLSKAIEKALNNEIMPLSLIDEIRQKKVTIMKVLIISFSNNKVNEDSFISNERGMN